MHAHACTRIIIISIRTHRHQLQASTASRHTTPIHTVDTHVLLSLTRSLTHSLNHSHQPPRVAWDPRNIHPVGYWLTPPALSVLHRKHPPKIPPVTSKIRHDTCVSAVTFMSSHPVGGSTGDGHNITARDTLPPHPPSHIIPNTPPTRAPSATDNRGNDGHACGESSHPGCDYDQHVSAGHTIVDRFFSRQYILPKQNATVATATTTTTPPVSRHRVSVACVCFGSMGQLGFLEPPRGDVGTFLCALQARHLVCVVCVCVVPCMCVCVTSPAHPFAQYSLHRLSVRSRWCAVVVACGCERLVRAHRALVNDGAIDGDRICMVRRRLC